MASENSQDGTSANTPSSSDHSLGTGVSETTDITYPTPHSVSSSLYCGSDGSLQDQQRTASLKEDSRPGSGHPALDEAARALHTQMSMRRNEAPVGDDEFAFLSSNGAYATNGIGTQPVVGQGAKIERLTQLEDRTLGPASKRRKLEGSGSTPQKVGVSSGNGILGNLSSQSSHPYNPPLVKSPGSSKQPVDLTRGMKRSISNLCIYQDTESNPTWQMTMTVSQIQATPRSALVDLAPSFIAIRCLLRNLVR
jgi:hypothetical protein